MAMLKRSVQCLLGARLLAPLAFLTFACGPTPPIHGHPGPHRPDSGADATAPDSGSDAGADTGTPPPDPVAAAYAALSAGEVQKLPTLLADLDKAFEQNTQNGRAAFYAGTFRLWKLGEDAQGYTIAEMAPFALPMIDRLRKAHELLPYDVRVPAFLGLAEVRVGLMLNSPDLIASGLTDLDEGIARLPAYGHFLRVSALNGTPRASADFAKAVSDMLLVAQYCGYKADASGTYEYLHGPLDYERHVCNNDGMVPHVWEGLFITFGDVMLKSGVSAEKARAIYKSAQNSPTYSEWRFAPELEERMAKAELRAALYADSDLSNDPPVWTDDGHVCTGCHQRRP